MNDYLIPEPTKQPIQSLVIFYKVLKGIEYDDRLWDKTHFARNMSAAQDLIEICTSYNTAKKCIEMLSTQYDAKDLSWTLETIVKNSHEWLNKGKRNDNKVRQRFFDALAKQRSGAINPKQGEVASSGEILSTLRNLQAFGDFLGDQGGTGDSPDGRNRKRMEQNHLETPKD